MVVRGVGGHAHLVVVVLADLDDARHGQIRTQRDRVGRRGRCASRYNYVIREGKVYLVAEVRTGARAPLFERVRPPSDVQCRWWRLSGSLLHLLLRLRCLRRRRLITG